MPNLGWVFAEFLFYLKGMIKGFRGTSLVDFPDRLAAVVFFAGCNFRCPFCYNVDLVLPERIKNLETLAPEEILAQLRKREGFIQGVVITGGEPTLSKNLLRSLLERIRTETDLAIKLDTNGSRPEVLKNLIEEGLLDYVALDLKTSPARYAELKGDFAPVKESLTILKEKGLPFEIRITAVPYLVTERDLEEMLPFLDGVPLIALQRFIAEAEILEPDRDLGLYGPEKLEELRSFLRKHVSAKVELRNV